LFKSLQLAKSEAGFSATVVDTDESQLPDGDVLAQVEYSSLNYKDGLAITNKGPVVRNWPMVAGIDGAGTVLESTHAGWKAGDKFVHNPLGFDGRAGAAAGRLAGKAASGLHHASGDGHWHGRLHRHAVRAGT